MVKLTAAGKTDPGRVREINEDNILLAPKLGLFLVCDGMGGHATGNIASKLAVKSIHNFFEATADTPFEESPHVDDGDAPVEARRLASAIRKANRDVHEISISHERHKGMGSTAVAIHILGAQLSIAHVGDSRCYRLRDGELKQLTRDHSLHNEALALKPNLSAEKLAKLPKNVVTRALGMKDSVQVELGHSLLEQGDIYLLCSDGLYNMVQEEDIAGILELQEDLEESCDLLITMANEAGGTDNISVLLVRVDSLENPPEIFQSTPSIQDEFFVSSYDLPLSEPPSPPLSGDEPLTPTRIVYITDPNGIPSKSAQVLEQERRERLLQMSQDKGVCEHCGFPRFSWLDDFCSECGKPLPLPE